MLAPCAALLVLAAVFRERATAEFRDSRDARERDCFAREKVYDRNADACYSLLTKGPCPRGEWFVLKKPASDRALEIEAECSQERCGVGEYFWSETESCVRPEEKSELCTDPGGEELRFNLFGEGECFCTREPPRGRLHDEKQNRCHLLYSQGPCRSGEVLGFDPDSPEPKCIIDKCFYRARQLKMLRKMSPDGVLAPWKNGQCYELGTRGPCPEGLTFKVHSATKRPTCVTLYNAIFSGNPLSCVRDLNNNCRRKVSKSSSANKYLRELRGIIESARKRRGAGLARGGGASQFA